MLRISNSIVFGFFVYFFFFFGSVGLHTRIWPNHILGQKRN